jgi:hypothetical protein
MSARLPANGFKMERSELAKLIERSADPTDRSPGPRGPVKPVVLPVPENPPSSTKIVVPTATRGKRRRGLTEADKKAVAGRQSWMCNRCAKPLPTRFQIDHIVEFAVGGSDHYTNLRALCGTCHDDVTEENRKSGRPEVWAGYPGKSMLGTSRGSQNPDQ